MRSIITISFIIILSFAFESNAQNVENYGELVKTLQGPYFGQAPPGKTSEIFASEVLVKSKDAHSNIVFAKNGTEGYWCFNGIWFSKMDDGKWTEPVMVPFSKKEFSDDAPILSPDGKHLFFTSKRPVNESDISRKENLWVVDILDKGWSEARPLPSVVNEMFQHWQASVDSKGNLYFGHRPGKNSDKDLYVSRYENGEYQKPVKLGDMINSDHNENNPYISPKGDYIIFTRINKEKLEDGRQNVSLFISFKLQNNSWSQSIDLKEYLKFQSIANCAIVSQDGNYLFFMDSYNQTYQRYWISADIINDVKRSHRERAMFKK